LETSAIPSTIIPGVTIAPDNFFVLKYAVFHHFRSLGWVVRSGIKFAVDFLLYNRGPAFSHAEFAVMVLPSYSHPYWSETSQRREECKKKESRDWWWFHRINRVQSLAHKSLMLVYVEVPPPWDQNPAAGAKLDIGAVLKQYKVREFVVGRWTPNRHR
jgi:tRNA-splicing endonuclease subunit Sen2